MSLLVVGSIALDTLRMPDGKVHKDVAGGSCSYFIHSASFFNRVRVVSVVGTDFPKKYIEGFTKRKADLAGLKVLPGKTFQWHGTYHRDMNNRDTDATIFGVLGEFDPVLPAKYLDSKCVFLACSQPKLQMKVLDQVQGSPVAVIDTIEFYIKNDRKDLDRAIRRCQGLLVSEVEARMLLGEDNLAKCAAELRKKYKLGFVVLKKGDIPFKSDPAPFRPSPAAVKG